MSYSVCVQFRNSAAIELLLQSICSYVLPCAFTTLFFCVKYRIFLFVSVCKDPPYKVEESGYAGFILPIEVYFKNKVWNCILFMYKKKKI